MKPSTRAALLSGLVFPGTGQIHLKHRRRGVAIMVCVLAGIGVIVWRATVKAFPILEQLQSRSERIDMETVLQLARTSSADPFPYSTLVLFFLVCCWLFSIVDAYRIGKRAEQTGTKQGA